MPRPLRAIAVRRAPSGVDVLLVGMLMAAVATLVLQADASDGFLDLVGGPALVAPVLAGAGWFAWRRPVEAVWLATIMPVLSGTVFARTGIGLAVPTQLVVIGLVLATVWAGCQGWVRAPAARVGLCVLVLYLVWTLASILSVEETGNAVEAFRQQYLMLLLIPALALRSWTEEQRRRMVMGVLAAATFAGLYAMFRYFVGPDAAESALQRAGAQTIGGEVTLNGSFLSRQELSGWTGVAIPALVALTPWLQRRRRIVAIVAIGACTAALLATQTRAGLVGAGAGVAVVIALLVLATSSRSRAGVLIGTVAIVGALAVGGYGLTIGGDEARTERISGVLDPGGDVTFAARRAKWRETIRELDGRPLGYGLGTAGSVVRERGRFVSADTFNIDNSYLQLAYQQGFAVVSVLVGALLLVLLALARSALAATPADAAIRVAACGALVSWLFVLTAGRYVERECTVLALLLVGLAMANVRRGPSAAA